MAKFKGVLKKRSKLAKKIKTPKMKKAKKLTIAKPKKTTPNLSKSGAKSKSPKPKVAGSKVAKKRIQRRTKSKKAQKGAAESEMEEAEEVEEEIDETEAGPSGVSEKAATSAVSATFEVAGTSGITTVASEVEVSALKFGPELPSGTEIYCPKIFTTEPSECLCPDCEEMIMTRTERVRGVRAWCCFMCLSLTICTFFCAWIPCVCHSCLDVKHYCPQCNRYLGRYRQCQCCN